MNLMHFSHNKDYSQ